MTPEERASEALIRANILNRDGSGNYTLEQVARAIREAEAAARADERRACAASIRNQCEHCYGTGQQPGDHPEVWCPYCGWQVDVIMRRSEIRARTEQQEAAE